MPNGWLGAQEKPGWPRLTNLRLDPFERLGFGPGESWMSFEHYFGHEMWRFVFMQEEVAKLAQTAIKYPPMQEGASFNLDAVKKRIAASHAANAN
jgi:arylsulfatase